MAWIILFFEVGCCSLSLLMTWMMVHFQHCVALFQWDNGTWMMALFQWEMRHGWWLCFNIVVNLSQCSIQWFLHLLITQFLLPRDILLLANTSQVFLTIYTIWGILPYYLGCTANLDPFPFLFCIWFAAYSLCNLDWISDILDLFFKFWMCSKQSLQLLKVTQIFLCFSNFKCAQSNLYTFCKLQSFLVNWGFLFYQEDLHVDSIKVNYSFMWVLHTKIC